MITRILYYYYKTLYLKYSLRSKVQLKKRQNKGFKTLAQYTLIHSPFYKEYLFKPFSEWPIVNKQIMMEHFDAINTVGIKKDKALALALKAEQTRDFSPMIDGITVGLSSGTSGTRGLFLASAEERAAWAGIILAKLLPKGIITPERVAFFLRANSRLYTTLNKSKKIQLSFFDLLGDFEQHIVRLNQFQPTILSAPASVLTFLAQHQHKLRIKPKKVISVAEVLDPLDEVLITEAFGVPIAEVYQCTEGFLAVSDKKTNSLVLNEEYLIIEKEWIDDAHFIPIITDLLRSTQPIIRYRLDDVLLIKKSDNVFTELAAIQGRLGDVCYGKRGDQLIPLFADLLRQAMVSSPIFFEDYLICQESVLKYTLQVYPEPKEKQLLINHLNRVFELKGCQIPDWQWQIYEKRAMDIKRRRIRSKLNS